MLSRNQEQEKIMFIIYQILFLNRMKNDFDLVEVIEDTMEENYSDVSVFVKEVVVKCVKNYNEIYNLILPNCTTWKMERINLVVISILMLGITEYNAHMVANTRRGYYRVASTVVLHMAISNKRLKQKGLVFPLDHYLKVHTEI